MHWVVALFDATMILFQSIVERVVGPVHNIAAQQLADRTWMRCMPIGCDAFWCVTNRLEHLLEKTLGCVRVSLLTRAWNQPDCHHHQWHGTESTISLEPSQRFHQRLVLSSDASDWTEYKALRKQMLSTPSGDHQDPGYRRLFYTGYADDFLLAVIGTKAEAVELKAWLERYLRDELQLELSAEKTLITHARKRVRFLWYDITRWEGRRIVRIHTKRGPITRRTGA